MPKLEWGSEEWLQEVFTYHAPSGDQQIKYQKVREAARKFARVLIDNTPQGFDQSTAVRLVREAVMTANASIALGGLT